MRGPFSFAKRKKELQRAEKQKKKDERKALRKALKEAVPGSPEALRLAALLGEDEAADAQGEGGDDSTEDAAGDNAGETDLPATDVARSDGEGGPGEKIG